MRWRCWSRGSLNPRADFFPNLITRGGGKVRKLVRAVIGIVCLLSVFGKTMAADPWQYVGVYAPIVYFNTLTVDVFPQGFPGDYSGTCVYADIKREDEGYLFRYWFYYRYDIRFNRYVDQAIKDLVEKLNARTINSEQLKSILDKLFHEHDWELVEVHVNRLGSRPVLITYHAHGDSHSLSPDSFPFGAPLEGTHPAIKVISDMHGSYPAGMWIPELTGWMHPAVWLEFKLVHAWEHFSGYFPEFGKAPPYKRIDFTYLCRSFSRHMKLIHSLPGYPYPMPWDRD